MSYIYLSEPIRRYIRNKNWTSLRPIQNAAISRIITTDKNYIITSQTASGKTEAAFLPILSATNFSENGVRVLYISPLIALINDQFYRIEDLCKDLEIPVTKWHGEASRALKKKIIRNPSGIVLITPESLEAMFVNASFNVENIFGNLKYIVIDEIHSFLGNDRGLHLISLLSRIQKVNSKRIITIGLSATIGDENFDKVKKFTDNIYNTKVLVDRSKKETLIKFTFIKSRGVELSHKIIQDIYHETKDYKVLLFPNSRGRVEEIAVKLKKHSSRENGHAFYFSHHSLIDRGIREDVEYFAKTNTKNNFCICCTSTLELGIDIGIVDKIVQIDSTYSVMSLVQRIGRSGRREGDKSRITIYATNKWSLLQSLACWLLYKENFIEPLEVAEKPYDILFHQMLSIVKQLNGCLRSGLIQLLIENRAFKSIPKEDICEIIDESITSGYLEVIGREIIIGLEGEKIINNKEFYSVFKNEVNLKVMHAGRKIGELPFSSQIRENENIFLAARIWKIVSVNLPTRRIEVIPALDGRKPIISGSTGDIHPRVREKMIEIIYSNESYEDLDAECKDAIKILRDYFRVFPIKSLSFERPVVYEKDGVLAIYTFTGTKINRSLNFLISFITNTKIRCREEHSILEIETNLDGFESIKTEIINKYKNIDLYMQEFASEKPSLYFSKWGSFLPLKFKCEILKERYFDFENSLSYLKNLNIIIPCNNVHQ